MQKSNRNTRSMPRSIGRYKLDVKLGEGASGIVYRALDTLMDRDVAIKMVKTESLTEEEIEHVIGEFHHEAIIAGKFAHENIVTIYDIVSDGKLDSIVMEYVPGSSVQDYMKATGPLDVCETLSIIYQCCFGLAYIHYHGVIHRDIKPGNIMYHPVQGIAKLMDFSIANRIEQPPLPDIGTIAYMAPEHFDPNRKITVLTDVFALGSTIYRVLTGKYPFTSKNTEYQILHHDPEPIAKFRSDVPQELVDIINKAMAKADADRFQSAAEFAREAERIINLLYPNSEVLNSSKKYMDL